MLLTKLTIKPGEQRVYTLNYSDWLQPEEYVDNAVVTVDNITDPPLTTQVNVIAENKVSLLVTNGLQGEEYTVSVEANTIIPFVTGDVDQTRIDCIGVSISEGCTQ